MVEEVRVPEPAFVPAGALAEEQAREEGLGGQTAFVTVAPPPGPCGPAPAVHHSVRRRAPPLGTRGRGYVVLVAYWVLKVILTPIFFVLWRVKVEGRENIPKKGPAVLAANHQSFCDSFFIPLVVRAR